MSCPAQATQNGLFGHVAGDQARGVVGPRNLLVYRFLKDVAQQCWVQSVGCVKLGSLVQMPVPSSTPEDRNRIRFWSTKEHSG